MKTRLLVLLAAFVPSLAALAYTPLNNVSVVYNGVTNQVSGFDFTNSPSVTSWAIVTNGVTGAITVLVNLAGSGGGGSGGITTNDLNNIVSATNTTTLALIAASNAVFQTEINSLPGTGGLTALSNSLLTSIASTASTLSNTLLTAIGLKLDITATNGMATASLTNGLATQAFAIALTNGFYLASNPAGYVTANITNGLATISYAITLTNSFSGLLRLGLSADDAQITGDNADPLLVGVAGNSAKYPELQYKDLGTSTGHFFVASSAFINFQNAIAVTNEILWTSSLTNGAVVWQIGIAPCLTNLDVTPPVWRSITQTVNNVANGTNLATIVATLSTNEITPGKDAEFFLIRESSLTSDTLSNTANVTRWSLFQ